MKTKVCAELLKFCFRPSLHQSVWQQPKIQIFLYCYSYRYVQTFLFEQISFLSQEALLQYFAYKYNEGKNLLCNLFDYGQWTESHSKITIHILPTNRLNKKRVLLKFW